ncbi:4-hydroxyphenylpyruvate dioxygenase [Streptosporangium sp. NPDC051023]|uniref:4-hydroxyphenylpyruvate dioxygenase n=1 Tax=Streptosporangium sp. NPDC051023 TaxID=3155410 RepID=UPI00344B8A34
MRRDRSDAFTELQLDHVRFAVGDLGTAVSGFTDGYGFAVHAEGTACAALGGGRIRLLLAEDPGYVREHGDGVADIAVRVDDAAAAFAEAVGRGAEAVAPPVERDGIVTATIGGFGGVTHTFVRRPDTMDPWALPGLTAADTRGGRADTGLREIDHFAVCVPPDSLKPAVEFYERVLDFEMIFEEHVVVGDQAMNSQVVQSRSGTVTLTMMEPDLGHEPGQIDDFLARHGGGGVQHIAFTSDDIVGSVRALGSRGVGFLKTPETYYDLVGERLTLDRHPLVELRELGILVDADHSGQLFQIFTRSVHERGTLFFEVIERAGALTFGSGNIKALYTAVERERAQDHDAR